MKEKRGDCILECWRVLIVGSVLCSFHRIEVQIGREKHRKSMIDRHTKTVQVPLSMKYSSIENTQFF